MIILSVLGILLICYLLGGWNAGPLMFWMIIRWPLFACFCLAALLNIEVFGFDPKGPAIISLFLACIHEDKIPDWVFDSFNLILMIALAFGMIYLGELIKY